MSLLAEDLLLLVLDDDSGSQTLDGTRLDLALGGALLLELALSGRVQVQERPGWFASDVVAVGDASPVGDPVLDEALATVGEKPRTPQDLVRRLGKGLRPRLLARLAERGVLRHERDLVWGLFPRDRWPAEDSGHERAVRARLHDVLLLGLTPDERTAALSALLVAVDRAHTAVPGLDATQRRAVKRRAKEVAEGAWAADAVRRAVEAMQAAVMTGVMVATTSAGTSGS